MLFISPVAVLGGAKSIVDIATFAEANESDFSEIVDLPQGAPSHDCFSRLFLLLDPDEMRRTFAASARALREGLGLGAANGAMAIDSKRLRGGYERAHPHMPALMASVRDAEARLPIAARGTGDEAAPALEVLKGLDLKGCIITTDALHCHVWMSIDPVGFVTPAAACWMYVGAVAVV
jgi:hypothetical protein